MHVMDSDQYSPIEPPPPPYSTVVSGTSPKKDRMLSSCPSHFLQQQQQQHYQQQQHQQQDPPLLQTLQRQQVGRSPQLTDLHRHHQHQNQQQQPLQLHQTAPKYTANSQLATTDPVVRAVVDDAKATTSPLSTTLLDPLLPGSGGTAHMSMMAENMVYSKMSYLEHIVSKVKSTLDSQAHAYKDVAYQIAELNKRMAGMDLSSSTNPVRLPAAASLSSGTDANTEPAGDTMVRRSSAQQHPDQGQSEPGIASQEPDAQFDRLSEMIDSLIRDANAALATSPDVAVSETDSNEDTTTKRTLPEPEARPQYMAGSDDGDNTGLEGSADPHELIAPACSTPRVRRPHLKMNIGNDNDLADDNIEFQLWCKMVQNGVRYDKVVDSPSASRRRARKRSLTASTCCSPEATPAESTSGQRCHTRSPSAHATLRARRVSRVIDEAPLSPQQFETLAASYLGQVYPKSLDNEQQQRQPKPSPVIAPVRVTDATPPPSTGNARGRSDSLVRRVRDSVTRGLLHSATFIDKSVSDELKKLSNRDHGGSAGDSPSFSPFGSSMASPLPCNTASTLSPRIEDSSVAIATTPVGHNCARLSETSYQHSDIVNASDQRYATPRWTRHTLQGNHLSRPHNRGASGTSPSLRQVEVGLSSRSKPALDPYHHSRSKSSASVAAASSRSYRAHKPQAPSTLRLPYHCLDSSPSHAPGRGTIPWPEYESGADDDDDDGETIGSTPRRRKSRHPFLDLHAESLSRHASGPRSAQLSRRSRLPWYGTVRGQDNDNDGYVGSDSSDASPEEHELLGHAISRDLSAEEGRCEDEFEASTDSLASRSSYEVTTWRPASGSSGSHILEQHGGDKPHISSDGALSDSGEDLAFQPSADLVAAAPKSPTRDNGSMALGNSNNSIISVFALFYWMLLFSLGVCMLDKFLCNIAGQRVLGTMEKITTTADTTADAEVDGHDTDSDGYEPQRNAPCIPDRALRCQQQPRYLPTAKTTTVALSEPPQGQRSVRNAMSQLVRWYIEEDEEASCSGSHQPLPLEEAARQSRRPLDKPKSTVFSTANIRDRRRRVVERGRPQFYRIQN